MDLVGKIKEEPICFEETSNTSCCEMGKEIEIKEEPVWLEGTASTSFPSTDIKDEICVDKQTVGHLVTCFKEEDKFGNIAMLTGSPVGTCNSSCKILEEGSEVMCILPTHNEWNLHVISDSEHRPVHPITQWPLCCNACSNTFSQKSHLREHLLFVDFEK
ncbi:uncharacterized protein [Anabrus simplex]|uniref:uncharacterized protein n=1 Tax=Anabrus simplex TaxID=316456 RepID=UPI0035A2736E